MSKDTSIPIAPNGNVPRQVQQVNFPAGSMGILGSWGQIMQVSAMVVIVMILLWREYTDRQDYVANRLAFENNIQRLQDQADRHTGEIKGAVDKNTEVMRDLISELRNARQRGDHPPVGAKPPAVELKPIPPI